MILAVALTIEMGFLSLTLTMAFSKFRKAVSVPALLAPPLVLLLGGVVGALAASALVPYQSVYLALISFGIAALLFLVSMELLREVAESQGDHVWWVDCCFFAGFLAAFLLGKFCNEGGEGRGNPG